LALHSYVRHWRHHADVLVVRPKYLSLRSPRSWRSWRLSGQCYCHDGVAAVAFPFINRMLLAKFSIHAVVAYLRRHDFLPDVVVTHMVPNLRWGAIIAQKFGARLVVGIHGSDVYRWNRHSGRIAAQADLVAFRSPAIERQFTATYGTSLVRRRVLAPSGIDRALIIGPGDRAWRSASNRPFTFVVAARLLKLKNIDCTLAALAGMRDRSWRLLIAGEGPEGPRLRALSEHLGLADRITFLGRLPHHQVLALFDQAEVLVMVSAPETFGLAYF
jgi:glycosyltransferase involved in cell wall biosynthesis